jgi:hypothetical protein
VAFSLTDAIRVIMTLRSGHLVHLSQRDVSVSIRSVAGQVSVFPAGVPSETVVEGDADAIQIFLPPEILGPASGRVREETQIVAATSEQLKLATLQLIVAARQNDTARCGAADARLRRIVHKLLVS